MYELCNISLMHVTEKIWQALSGETALENVFEHLYFFDIRVANIALRWLFKYTHRENLSLMFFFCINNQQIWSVKTTN